MKLPFEFKPEDFSWLFNEWGNDVTDYVVKRSNELLAKWLASAPVVLARENKKTGEDHIPYKITSDMGHTKNGLYTHTAKLLLIEPIVHESEERKLLREFVDIVSEYTCIRDGTGVTLANARKLLEPKE